ncbi:B-cell receptor CD22-like [Chanos chanos]|uniref:B-cell receptor CD22 n=1 Tax=Chanos chanos TaxID=29144 RepID=A0A6J2VSR3_CHACN|nr:B-cell receptor CD22-like [Chanos chanos]
MRRGSEEGVYGQNWGVTYNPDSICVLKGSSVTMSCSYTYPNDNTVKRTFWTKGDGSDPPNLSEDSGYKGRVHYLGDKQSNCAMQLINVTQTDSKRYRFRFTTDKNRWLGQPGVQLSVTDLQVETPERVKEGDTVTLKCRTTCTLSNTPTFIWYKNGHVLTRKHMKNNELSFQSVSSEDRGSYVCAVQGHENLPSPAVTLTVIYPPKKTTVSVSPSGEIVEGSSVTLTCSSDANPPQINYTWYKESLTSPVEYGQSYIINNIQSSNSGLYYCEAQNKHGSQKTTAVPITLKDPPKKLSVSVSPSGETMEGSSVTLTCTFDANPPVEEYSWFKIDGNIVLTKGNEQNYRINKISSEDSGEYKCKSSNQHGYQYSDSVYLNVLYAPKKTTVSVSPSGKIVEGSSVTLTCSSDANPPQINYTWYKENVTSPVGYGQSYIINNIQSNNSGLYYCDAQNKHGSQKTTAVPITLKANSNVSAAMFECPLDELDQYSVKLKLDHLYNDVPLRGFRDDTKSHDQDTQDDPANQDDNLYVNVTFSKPDSSCSVSNICNDDLYANI